MRSLSVVFTLLAVLFIPVLVFAQFTLGKVQSSITEGMDQAEVAAAIGAPNMVTQDRNGNETWIYDKISTTVTESEQSQGSRDTTAGGVGFGIGVGKSLLGLGGGTSQSHFAKERSGTTTQSSKTLTVVIKFDEAKRVKKVRFNQSAF